MVYSPCFTVRSTSQTILFVTHAVMFMDCTPRCFQVMVKILTKTVPMEAPNLILVHPKKVCWSPCVQTQYCFCFVGGLRACERSRGKRAVWEGVTHPPILYRFKYSVLDLLSYPLLLILILSVSKFLFFLFFFLCGEECKGPFVTLTSVSYTHLTLPTNSLV